MNDVNVIEIYTTDHNLIYIGASDGIYVSKDSGKTLEKLKSTRALGGFISIEMQKDNANVIYIASSSEVFKTEDAGTTWKDITGPLKDIHRVRISGSNPNILYASTFNGIFRSDDYGETWQESDEGFPHEKHTAIHDVQIDPKNTNIIYAATTKHEATVGIGIYKSNDVGKTWRAINSGLDDLSVGTIAIHPENTEILLAATHSGLYKSTNGGQSWKRTSSSHSFDVEYVKNDPNIVYASTNDGVLKSKDFGENWYKVNYGLPSGEGQGIGVGIDGNVIYAAVKKEGIYVARLTEVEPIEPVSIITDKDFGFAMGRGVPGGFDFPDFFGKDEGPEDFPGPGGFPERGEEIEEPEIKKEKEETEINGIEKEKIEIEEEIREPKKEEVKTQEGFFARIANFFKRLFGKG